VCVTFSQFGTLRRRELDRASIALQQGPSLETELEFNRRKKVNLLYRYGIPTVAFVVMASLTQVYWYGFKQRVDEVT
jgi:hypothetical protein